MDIHLIVGRLVTRAKSMKDILERYSERGVFTEYGKGYYQGYADGLSEAVDITLQSSEQTAKGVET